MAEQRRYRAGEGFTGSALRVLVLTLSLGLAFPQAAVPQALLKIGDPAPRVSLNDLTGNELTIPDSLRGSVAVIHFWAEGCSSCAREMPALEALYAEYRKKGFVVIAVNVGQKKDAVSAFVGTMGVSYPVVLDPDNYAAKRYEVFGLPRTFFLDRKGFIRYKILGEASEKTLKRLALKIL
ncbi:MAG: TlpA family protein disulfide reductase [Nitrospirota bacterium]|nr:TlpA family protein disulfide reductase [Nitrospirota bacterium]